MVTRELILYNLANSLKRYATVAFTPMLILVYTTGNIAMVHLWNGHHLHEEKLNKSDLPMSPDYPYLWRWTYKRQKHRQYNQSVEGADYY